MNDSLADAIGSRFRLLLSGRRLGQFASAGLTGTAVDTLTLFLLVEYAGFHPIVAKLLAWEIALAVIFTINERWTFSGYGASSPRALGKRYLRSHLVRFGGLLVTLSVLAGLVYGFGIWYLVANLLGIGAGFVVNYTCESLYTWKVHDTER